MKRSTNRILTTHVGSLPRPADLLEMMDKGGGGDPQAYEQRLRSAVAEIVNKQVELGIDVIDDGEYSKPSFVTYINQRLGGFETDTTGDRHQSMVDVARSAGVSGLLQRARQCRTAAAAEHGLHRAGHLQGPRSRQTRHREFQGRARRT